MNIEIKEDLIQNTDNKLLELLLADRSTKRNIVWATNDYIEYGELYSPECEITTALITGTFSNIIRPRVTKAKEEQNNRTRNKAEVFTPSWICNQQNNLVDEQWFGTPDIFNTVEGKTWIANKDKIKFANKSWQDYIHAKRMEITCGEAPYLVSRYDTVTGNMIADVNERIGLLDRKLRVVNENTDNEEDWLAWVKKAYQSIYGYEYQGDNLLLARENLLFTFIDNMHYKFNREPTDKELQQIAYIISWNMWQMDGLKYTAPYSKSSTVLCVIKNWADNSCVKFQSLVKRNKMNFDVVVGNPPYQIMDGGAQASAKPVYNFFMEQAKAVQPKYVSMIMPARWYTGGKGLDDFRNRMIHDPHIITLHDFVDSNMCFTNVNIKGGICYCLWSANNKEKCDIYRHEDSEIVIYSNRYLAEENETIFIRYNELISIKNKVRNKGEDSFESIVSTMKPYGLRGDFFNDTSKYGLPKVSSTHISGGYKILGLKNLKRKYRYIPSDYPLPKKDMLHDYKVFITRNYGSGNLGDLPSKPVVAVPGELCTETFVQIGPFKTELEAQNVIKYIQTKFFRAMVGLRKQDQNASKAVYHFVPLQNFSESSDIDWDSVTEEIDEQLYKKYALSEDEIDFINSKIK